MKIKMLKTTKGSPDGFTVRSYAAGKEYNLSGGPGNDLAKVFVEQMEVAVEVKPKAKVIEIKVPEEKLEIQTPEQVKIETPEKVVVKKAKSKAKPKPARTRRREK